MEISYYTFAVGVLLFILSIVQFNLHAEDGWIGEAWDSEVQERLYYVIAPASSLCIFSAFVFRLLGL